VLAVRLDGVDGFAAAEPLFAPDRHGRLGSVGGPLLYLILQYGPFAAAG